LFLADGENDLLTISEKSRIGFFDLLEIFISLEEKEMVEKS